MYSDFFIWFLLYWARNLELFVFFLHLKVHLQSIYISYYNNAYSFLKLFSIHTNSSLNYWKWNMAIKFGSNNCLNFFISLVQFIWFILIFIRMYIVWYNKWGIFHKELCGCECLKRLNLNRLVFVKSQYNVVLNIFWQTGKLTVIHSLYFYHFVIIILGNTFFLWKQKLR